MDTRISEEVRFKARQVGASVKPIACMQMLLGGVHEHGLPVSYSPVVADTVSSWTVAAAWAELAFYMHDDRARTHAFDLQHIPLALLHHPWGHRGALGPEVGPRTLQPEAFALWEACPRL